MAIFSVVPKEPLPTRGTDDFPMSERALKKNRTKIEGYEFVESFGAMTPPYRFTHKTYIQANLDQRYVILKDAVEKYKVDLNYIDKHRKLLVVHYEDQFLQSRIEVFKSK